MTFPLMTSTAMRRAMHHGTSSHNFGGVVIICMGVWADVENPATKRVRDR